MKLNYVAATDVGREREKNEDCFAVFTTTEEASEDSVVIDLDKQGMIFIVADGMGGPGSGEVASELAVSEIRKFLDELTPSWNRSSAFIEKALGNAIEHAHKKIFSHAKKHYETKGMGTTVVLAYLYKDDMHVAWAGDSRLYLYREDKLQMISHDHSEVQELIDEGELSYAESLYHPHRHRVTKCLGGLYQEPFEPEFRLVKMQLGDRILLCSDGLTTMLVDQEISDIMLANPDLDACAQALIDRANERGGEDNITVILGEILQDSPN
jgi:protein phosphatase